MNVTEEESLMAEEYRFDAWQDSIEYFELTKGA